MSNYSFYPPGVAMNWGFEATVLADSVSPAGDRLTTLQVRYPHAVHKDVMTHRALSRNFLSFRAYPPEKLYEMLSDENCFVPEIFTERQPGMSGGVPLTDQSIARMYWLEAKNFALMSARHLVELGVSKEQANIPIQDYCWITGIVSATDWDNFFALRMDTYEDGRPKARPEVYKIASMMKDAIEGSEPVELQYGQWHLPLVTSEELWDGVAGVTTRVPNYAKWKMVSTGRCARISYLTHDGVRDPEADVRLHDNLKVDFHMSPFEHVARPTEGWSAVEPLSNFNGWHQYRKDIPGEANYATAKEIDLA